MMPEQFHHKLNRQHQAEQSNCWVSQTENTLLRHVIWHLTEKGWLMILILQLQL